MLRFCAGAWLYAALATGCATRASLLLANGETRELETDQAALAILDDAWRRGSTSSDDAHGTRVAEWRCTRTDRQGNLIVKTRQRFIRGAVVYRELRATPSFDVVSVVLEDVHSDRARTGFRISGVLHVWELPPALAYTLSHPFGSPDDLTSLLAE